MNLAALWQLPVLFCCENNRYAMGTVLLVRSRRQFAVKASGYAMPAWTVDGMDVLAVRAAARHATTAIRAGGGRHFLELETYRFRAHSMYDPERYRAKDGGSRMEAARSDHAADRPAAARRSSTRTRSQRWTDASAPRSTARSRSPRRSTLEPVEDLTRFVYSDLPMAWGQLMGTTTTYREALRKAIARRSAATTECS